MHLLKDPNKQNAQEKRRYQFFQSAFLRSSSKSYFQGSLQSNLVNKKIEMVVIQTRIKNLTKCVFTEAWRCPSLYRLFSYLFIFVQRKVWKYNVLNVPQCSCNKLQEIVAENFGMNYWDPVRLIAFVIVVNKRRVEFNVRGQLSSVLVFTKAILFLTPL